MINVSLMVLGCTLFLMYPNSKNIEFNDKGVLIEFGYVNFKDSTIFLDEDEIVLHPDSLDKCSDLYQNRKEGK